MMGRGKVAMTMSQDTCLLRVHTINLRGIGGGMLTKQNALFVTVRQTPKVHERVHFRTPSHLLRVCLALCDESH